MAKLNIFSIKYKGTDYRVTEVPDVFTHQESSLLIGSHALNSAVYDDEKGYPDVEARRIDEQIYAYAEDECFNLDYENFVKWVQRYLD